MNIFSKKQIDPKLVKNLKEEPYYPVIIESDSLSLVHFEGDIVYKSWLSTKMVVTKFIMDEDSNQKYLEITATTKFGEASVEIPYSLLNRKDISQILSFGWSYDEKYLYQLIMYLVKAADQAPHIIKYDRVGWFEYNNSYIFRTNHIIEDENNIGLSEKYKYTGLLKLDKSMSCDNYLDDLNILLITGGTMLAVVTGLSSALISLLSFHMPINNMLIHIYADSSKGKSTFARLALSCWGSPEEPLFNYWNSTSTALYATLSNNYGVTLGFDEASCTTNDFTSIIYNLSHGRDKAKCNKDSSLKQSKGWITTIISTAEESLIANSKKNSGIRARLIEFFNLNITKDSNHSEKLNSFVQSNYGVLGEQFIKLLYKKGKNKIFKEFEQSKQYVLNNLKEKCAITDRISIFYAVLLLTAEYAKELDLNIDINLILDILIEQHNSLIEETNITNKLYNSIVEYILNNGKKFHQINDKFSGNYEGLCTRDSYFICEGTFEKILKNNGFSDIKVMIKKLHAEGYLKKHNDRYYVKRTINEISVKCYEFKKINL